MVELLLGLQKKLSLNNVSSTDNLTDFPLLVRLNSTTIDYSKTDNSGDGLTLLMGVWDLGRGRG